MKYTQVVQGIFKDRPNRFIAHVLLEGRQETVHVKNTGRCKELLVPGAPVILELADHPKRKTKYDLVGVYKEGLGLVNMDSQAPNKVAGEWILSQSEESTGRFWGLQGLKPEYTYGNSRLDFYFEYGTEKERKKVLMEVKGVTLEQERIAYFPDAPTLRGVKHIEELIRAAGEGYESYLAFVIQMEGIDVVYPNTKTHREFGEALDRARAAGVKVLHLGCRVEKDGLWVDRVREQGRKN